MSFQTAITPVPGEFEIVRMRDAAARSSVRPVEEVDLSALERALMLTPCVETFVI
jgi:hypothetical protein